MAKPTNDAPAVETSPSIPMNLDAQEDSETRRRMDPELRVMAAMLRMLDELHEEARVRVVAYISNRYQERPF